MEIEIPKADQDSGTEGPLTDRTGCQTVSDGWSREGHVSGSALTSRSVAPSRVSQPRSSVAPDDAKDVHINMENGDLDLEVNASATDAEGAMFAERGREGGISDGKGQSEDTSGSSHLAAEDATVKNLAALSQSVSSQKRDGESEQAVDTSEQKAVEDEVAHTAAEIEPDYQDTEVESPEKISEMDANLKATEDASEAKLYSTDQNTQGPPADVGSSETNADAEKTVDGDGDHNEEGFYSGDGNNSQSGDQNEEDFYSGDGNDSQSGNQEGEAHSKVTDRKPLAAMAGVEDSETPQYIEQSRDNGMGIADSEEPGPDTDIQQDRVFITENTEPGGEGSDISDVRAETPNWEEEVEENDGASVSDICGVSQKHCRSSATSRPRPLTRSTLHEEIAPGQRAVVNTPVSYITATDFNAEVIRNMESRNTSHAGLEATREAAFQRAMTLMTDRCDSKQKGTEQGELLSFSLDASYGPKCPQYFYVQQRKPAPMPPLKAWRGYHGNVYFEPIHIKKVGDSDKADQGTQKATPSIASRKSSGSRRRTGTLASQSLALVPVDKGEESQSVAIGDAQPPTRSTTRLTFKRGPTSAKSKASSRSVAAVSQHHVLYLDKQAVINPDNTAMHEELQIIEKQRSTGSLNVQQRGHFPNPHFHGKGGGAGDRVQARRSGASSAKFDRICKGSVVHTLRRAKSGGPLGNSMSRGRGLLGRKGTTQMAGSGGGGLVVVGDRFAPPTVMSPLLRTQTQFSLSSQRITTNSPDLYGAFERLPPLEQVRISLRHMDAHSDDTYTTRGASPYSTGTSVGVVEELKPFIKYSPDVKAQYNRQIKYY